MGLIIGMDEAGYGPNLGPLVVTASVWRVPGDPRRFDFWQALESAISQVAVNDGRLHVADSKQVYSSARGLAALERSVLSILGLMADRPMSFRGVIRGIVGEPEFLDSEPWYHQGDVDCPLANCADDILNATARLSAALSEAGVKLIKIRSDVVLTERFNRFVGELDNKAGALSRITLNLLKQVWLPDTKEPVLIIGDKHGGRNRYDELLSECCDGVFAFRIEEGAEISRYKVGRTELRFQPGAEVHFPVAVSSMICKYTRELSLELFNGFWQRHVQGLKPTKGYYSDAVRFRSDIADVQQRLGIPDAVLWRER